MDLSLHAKSERNDGIAGVTVLEVRGEVDAYSAPSLAERISEILASDVRRLVVDLNGVVFIDSTGLGVLVRGLNDARDAGVQLELVCNVERVIKLLRITGLDDVFTIHDSVDDTFGEDSD